MVHGRIIGHEISKCPGDKQDEVNVSITSIHKMEAIHSPSALYPLEKIFIPQAPCRWEQSLWCFHEDDFYRRGENEKIISEHWICLIKHNIDIYDLFFYISTPYDNINAFRDLMFWDLSSALAENWISGGKYPQHYHKIESVVSPITITSIK